MRLMLDTVSMRGVVVIGEGEKDEAPMLYNGEEVGDGDGPEVDVAVDPLEGTRLTALGHAERDLRDRGRRAGSDVLPGAAVYMDKIAVGPEAADAIDIDATPTENVRRVAEAKGMRVERPHRRRARARPARRPDRGAARRRRAGEPDPDGDVAPAIAAARPGTGVDLLMGVGGTPEGVISAAAIKCLGGALQGGSGRGTTTSAQRLVDAGYDVDRVLTTDDLVQGEDVFVAATGVTSGALLRGVRVERCRRRDGVDRDALALRNGAADRGLPSLRRSRADERRTLMAAMS